MYAVCADQTEDQRQRPDGGAGLNGEQGSGGYRTNAGDHHEPAAIQRVGEGAADQAEHGGGEPGRKADGADPEGAAGELPDLVQHGDHGHLPAEGRGRRADPQPAESRVRPQRPRVDDAVEGAHEGCRGCPPGGRPAPSSAAAGRSSWSWMRCRNERRRSASDMSSTTRVSG